MCRSTLLTTALLLGLCSEAPAQDPALPAPLLPLAPAAGPVGLGASSRRASSVPGRVFPKETVGGPATKKQDLRLIQVDPLTLNESDPVWGLPRGGRRHYQNENPARQTARIDGNSSREQQLRAQYVGGVRNLQDPSVGGYSGRHNSLFFAFPFGNGTTGAGGAPLVIMGVR